MKDIPHFDVSDRQLSARSLVCGVGVNDAPYITQPKVDGKTLCCPFYRIWVGMLRKAHSTESVTVCQEWRSFMAFRDWAVSQDCRGRVLNIGLLSLFTQYCPDKCAFILPSTANLIKECSPASVVTHGVDEHQGRWRAMCHGKYLGHFDQERDARAARCRAKAGLLVKASLVEKDSRVVDQLVISAAELLNVSTT